MRSGGFVDCIFQRYHDPPDGISRRATLLYREKKHDSGISRRSRLAGCVRVPDPETNAQMKCAYRY